MIAIIIVLILVLLYTVSTYINGKMEVPASCVEITVESCNACKSFGCPVRKKE